MGGGGVVGFDPEELLARLKACGCTYKRLSTRSLDGFRTIEIYRVERPGIVGEFALQVGPGDFISHSTVDSLVRKLGLRPADFGI